MACGVVMNGTPRARTSPATAAACGLDPVEVYRSGAEAAIQLAEGLVEWDEAIAVWRVKHYQTVARIIGEDVVGTQGTPVELLAGLIKNRMFPELWRVRTQLTELAKQSD